MGKTISTHNGSKANRDHNIRNPKVADKEDHIDKTLSCNNEYLYDEKPQEAYKRIFGKALADYNARQERPERRIKDYYNHIGKNSKKHQVYEMIVQIGDRKDTGLNAPTERECLKEFYQEWKERNPNLECIGAYIHADEVQGTIHMHIDYVPVAHGFKRGMETQTGLVRALKEQGFEKNGKETAQILWERRENQVLEKICLEHGIEVRHPNEGRKHEETKEYKQRKRIEQELDAQIVQKEEKLQNSIKSCQEAEKMLCEVNERVTEVKKEVALLLREKKKLLTRTKAIKTDVNNRVKRLQELPEGEKNIMGKIALKEADYEKLIHTAKRGLIIEPEYEENKRNYQELSAKYEKLKSKVPTMKERMEIAQLKADFQNMEKKVERLTEQNSLMREVLQKLGKMDLPTPAIKLINSVLNSLKNILQKEQVRN